MFMERFSPELVRPLIEKAKVEAFYAIQQEYIKSGKKLTAEMDRLSHELIEKFAINFMNEIDAADQMMKAIEKQKPKDDYNRE